MSHPNSCYDLHWSIDFHVEDTLFLRLSCHNKKYLEFLENNVSILKVEAVCEKSPVLKYLIQKYYK